VAAFYLHGNVRKFKGFKEKRESLQLKNAKKLIKKSKKRV